MMALITKRKRPKVKMVTGKVSITNIGLTVIRNKPKSKATLIAEKALSTVTPGKKCAIITTAIAVKAIFNKIFMCLSFYR